PLRRRADTTDGAARSCVRPPGGPAAEPPFCQPLVPEPAGTPTSHLSRHRGPLAKPGPLQKESQSIPHAQTNSPLASYKCVHTKALRAERGLRKTLRLPVTDLLHRHALREIAGLVDVGAFEDGDVVGE